MENRAFDRSGLVDQALAGLASWRDRRLLDLGCGSGYHLPRWAETASRVIGVEPHRDLAAMARRRARRAARSRPLSASPLAPIEVHEGTAQAIPLPDRSVDVVQVRWAYFFGPGCEPGLDELARVIARGGTAMIIDNDATTSTFGRWFARGYPMIDSEAVERFWAARGWRRTPIVTSWQFDNRADFESVVRIEFDPATAAAILNEHEGFEVDYAVNIWSRDF